MTILFEQNMLRHNSGYLLQISLETHTPLQKYAQENQQRNLREVHLERCTQHPILLLPNATGSRVTLRAGLLSMLQ
jgi:hypothetical protein